MYTKITKGFNIFSNGDVVLASVNGKEVNMGVDSVLCKDNPKHKVILIKAKDHMKLDAKIKKMYSKVEGFDGFADGPIEYFTNGKTKLIAYYNRLGQLEVIESTRDPLHKYLLQIIGGLVRIGFLVTIGIAAYKGIQNFINQ